MQQGWKGSDMLNNRWVNKLALTKSHLLELHGPKELIPNWPEQCARSASVAVLEGHCWAVFRVQWWSSAIAGGCSYCWRYLFETTDDCFPDCYSFLHTLEDVWRNTSNNSKKTKNKNKKNTTFQLWWMNAGTGCHERLWSFVPGQSPGQPRWPALSRGLE